MRVERIRERTELGSVRLEGIRESSVRLEEIIRLCES